MPTTPSEVYSGSGVWPAQNQDEAKTMPVFLSNGTYAKGTVLGELTADQGTFAAYATAAVDGTGVARAILQYACVVASGKIYLGDTAGVGPALLSAPAWFKGIFRCEELTGLDADAVVDLGRLVSGSTTTGLVAVQGG